MPRTLRPCTPYGKAFASRSHLLGAHGGAEPIVHATNSVTGETSAGAGCWMDGRPFSHECSGRQRRRACAVAETGAPRISELTGRLTPATALRSTLPIVADAPVGTEWIVDA